MKTEGLAHRAVGELKLRQRLVVDHLLLTMWSEHLVGLVAQALPDVSVGRGLPQDPGQ
jgi:hypothetical protein